MKPPQRVAVTRSDPVYMAHGYLTKVPTAAITPFIQAHTKPGDLILDPFAGSGMTGVAAAMTGRRAILYDVSALGRHIGTNYVRLVEPAAYRDARDRAVQRVSDRLPGIYSHECSRCGRPGELSRRVWSVLFECPGCRTAVNYYTALRAANSRKADIECPSCHTQVDVRSRRGEEAVLDTISCVCSSSLFDQAPSDPQGNRLEPEGLSWPTTTIGAELQMFQASALGKHGLTSIDKFFGKRNLLALAALRGAILMEPQEDFRSKLLFAFTAILPRASKRYQWGPDRPLNAATHNYYIAPIFYEWNVLDLFTRKVEAIIKSDEYIRTALGGALFARPIDVRYEVQSAVALPLESSSVDYVFTDPPFGSNIFYSDMNLFQEAWLDVFTDPSDEAVVDRRGSRGAKRYEDLMTGALIEAARVLKPSGRLSLVFSNSSGQMWALVQRAIRDANLELLEDGVAVLDKGQRSVKGLNSGRESVVTSDLILTMKKSNRSSNGQDPAPLNLEELLKSELVRDDHLTPSHVYLDLVRRCLRDYVDLSTLSFNKLIGGLKDAGYRVDSASGRIVRDPTEVGVISQTDTDAGDQLALDVHS